MMGDYCTRIDVGQISLGFQPNNPIIFYIINCVLLGVSDNMFDTQAIKPDGVTDD